MNEEQKQADFVKRCKGLEARLKLIRALTESSDRVWVSTMSVVLCEIFAIQDNAQASFDQFISSIQETWEKLNG